MTWMLLAGLAVASMPADSPGSPAPPAPGAEGGTPSATPPPDAPPDEGVLAGSCEASGIVAGPDGTWWVVDNEVRDRVLVYDAAFVPRPPQMLDGPIDDLEAIAFTPKGAAVFGSQGGNKHGERRPARERAAMVGRASTRVDLRACAACDAARGLPPEEGGLNVEGAAWWRGRIWVGLRSPRVGERALLVSLGDDLYGPALPVEPLLLDLAGDGVRDLAPWGAGLLVLSGPVHASELDHRLWWLPEPGARPVPLPVPIPPQAEGIAVGDDGLGVLVTDGDGKPGELCGIPARWLRLDLRGILPGTVRPVEPRPAP
jgi:hypothetical protein